MRLFGEAQIKATRAYAQSRQYYTIVESRVRLTWYQSHALNLVEAHFVRGEVLEDGSTTSANLGNNHVYK